MSLAAVSVGPPAGKATTMRMTLSGQAAARAGCGNTVLKASAAEAWSRCRRWVSVVSVIFMGREGLDVLSAAENKLFDRFDICVSLSQLRHY